MPLPRLTPRQLAMIHGVMEGQGYDVIAADLGVTRDTVAHQLVAARLAWGAGNNAHLIALLIAAGLLTAPDLPRPVDGDSDLGRAGGLVLLAAVVDTVELWAILPVAAALLPF
ncbi:MAG: hypothetical protein SGI84_15025 [Gemmatimonadota bacterium]|nr:hypothetical protein [Gemmatimonadota bacterium]